ncbi:unnamed protein product [Fusarium graminearum]|uniref:Uncharacterized protein n=1 Tax=Gibberella zeae TaxID=5518 RepID=A0A4E9DZK1_GIBZA|nr:unnamed protein product [Fusarium graminearum]CAF3503845.1 unnamed protein product [Fusarium graminearum]CAG1977163.1 unnamed protein product [Fusarium graminearum]
MTCRLSILATARASPRTSTDLNYNLLEANSVGGTTVEKPTRRSPTGETIQLESAQEEFGCFCDNDTNAANGRFVIPQPCPR